MAVQRSTAPTAQLENRRPLKVRSWRIFQRLSALLADWNVSPNAISVASVVAGAGAGICLWTTSLVSTPFPRAVLWLAAAIGIQLRLIANLLDGMVAVEGGKASAVGDLYNEVPDRLSDTAILTGAGFAIGGHPLLGLTASLIAVFVAYVRAIGASVGAGQVFAGPFAKPQRMALMTVTCITSAFFPPINELTYSFIGLGLSATSLAIIILGGIVTSIRRLRIIAQRMRAKSA